MAIATKRMGLKLRWRGQVIVIPLFAVGPMLCQVKYGL